MRNVRLMAGILMVGGFLGCTQSYDVSGEAVFVPGGKLSDDQSLRVIIDANNQQLELTRLVYTRAYDSRLVAWALNNDAVIQTELAREMILLNTLGYTGDHSTANFAMRNVQSDAIYAVVDQGGTNFDKAFIREERKVMATLLSLIENRLSGDVYSWSWRQELKAVRDSTDQRLSALILLQEQLGY